MLKQQTTKSIFFLFATFVLIFVNTQISWAVRNPDEEHANRDQSELQNKPNSARTIISPATANIPNTAKVIKKGKRAKHAPEPIMRDLRDLTKLKTVLSGKPKTEDEISVALINLLKTSPHWLGEVLVKDLRLDYVKIVSSVDGRAQDAYARFVQQHRGNDIEDSYIAFTLKILPDWTIISSAQAKLYPRLKFRTAAHKARALTDELVDRQSLKSLRLEGKRVHKRHDKRRVRFIDGEWRKVREVEYEESDYKAVIDEDSDEVWIEDMRMYGTIHGKVEGRGILFDPQATGTNLNILKLKDLKFSTTSGTTAYSDALGNFNFSSETNSTNVSAGLIGRWAQVISKKNDNLTFGGGAVPGSALNITFNPTGASESAIAQVNGYYHTTFIHDWLQARLAPNSLPALDVTFPVNVNINSTCNAFYNGSSINFYSAGGSCINTAYDTVVYHEYGHFVDHRIGGITNGGLSEGWGDVVATYATGQPIIGEGFFGPGTKIRRADNNYQYPANGNAEVHVLGQAWAGFAWHLRENLIASLGQEAGIATAENLIIPTLYANSADIPTAVYDVLIRDDNDANLGNSTPHYMEIAAAAARHSIPLPENDVTSPAPVIDLHVLNQDELTIYLSWTASGDDGRVGTASSYDIRYSLSPIQSEEDFAAATLISNSMVPLPSGKVESMSFNHPVPNTTYYFAIKVFDNMKNTSTLSNVIATMVPANVVAFENFENGALGWTSNGLWHATTDRSNSPVKSFAYNNGVNYDTGARTFGSLISPVIAIPSNADRIVINFKEWVDVEKYESYDKRSIAISDNNGVSWFVHPLPNASVEHQHWQNYSTIFSGYAGKNVRVRFLFDSVDAVSNLTEGWYVDDVGIYYTKPPVFETISNQTVDAGQTLTFSVSATDPDGQPLTYSALGLPQGATFNNQTFSWSPTLSQVGTHGVKFIVSNGNLSDQKTILITVENPDKPDLIVQEMVLASSTVPLGDQLLMSDKVKNIGSSSASISSLRITLSTDAVYGGTDDIYLMNTNIPVLQSGGEVENSRAIPILGTIPLGQYYVCAKIDSDTRIPESNEDNNTRCSETTVAITSAILPDLVITAMNGPSEYIQGTPVPLNVTIKNQGAGIASNFRIAYFISTDPIITPSSDQLVSVQYMGTFPPGATFNASMFSDRLYLPPGTYYWGAYVDDNGVQPESNEANNSFVGNAVTILGLTAPVLNSAIPGDKTVTLNWSAVPSATSYLIEYGTVSGNYSGSVYLQNITSFTVLNLTAGQPYYFVVFAKNAQGYSASSNEKSATPLGLPDLVMSNLSGPTSAIQGKTVTLNDKVSNTGLSSTGVFEVAYYLSTDQTISTSDILVATRLISGLLKNSNSVASVDVEILDSLAPGNYYWGAIADYKQAQSEVDETNNIILGNSVTIKIPVPATPVLNSGTPGVGEIALSWNSVSTATGYNVMYGTKSGVYTTLINAGNVTSFTIPNLFNGVTYYIAIVAINSTGSSAASNEISAVPQNLVDVAKIAIDNYFQELIGGQDTTLSKAALDAAIAAVLNPSDITIITDYYDSAALATAKTAVDNLFAAIAAGEDINTQQVILTMAMLQIMNPADKTVATEYYDSVALTTAKTAVDNLFAAIAAGEDINTQQVVLTMAMSQVMNPADKTVATEYYDSVALRTAKTAVDNLFAAIAAGEDINIQQVILTMAMTQVMNPADKATATEYYDSVALATAKTAVDNLFAAIAAGEDINIQQVILTMAMSQVMNPADKTAAREYYDSVALTTAKTAVDNLFAAIAAGEDINTQQVILTMAMSQVMNPADKTAATEYYDSVALATAKTAVDNYVQALIDGQNAATLKVILNAVIAEIMNPNIKADANDYYEAALIKTIKPVLNSGVPGNAEVTLSWDNVSSATGYTIKYGTVEGEYSSSIEAGNVNDYAVHSLTNGTMYYFVVMAKNAVGSSMISNQMSATPKESVPDLIINEVSISSNGKVGSPVVITDTVLNQGTGDAGGFYVAYYLSTDSVITLNDKILNYRYVPTLAKGASSTRSITINIPNMAPGIYYVGAIADAFNHLGEADENNNIVTGNTITITLSGADLVMTAVNGSANGKVGSPITITDTVTNQGADNTSGFYVAYYLSTDAVITTGDKFLYYRYVPSLVAGTSNTRSLTVAIPNVAPGNYFLGAIADAFNGQGESNENNNTITGNMITVTTSNMDLVTSALSAPASGKVGAAVTVTDTVTNQGTENANAFYMGYYLSTDPVITTSDRLVYYRYVPSLAAGASNTGSVTYNIPNLAPGTYYWGAIADAFNSQGEVNEGNNAKLGNKIEVASSTVDMVMSALNGPAIGKVGSLATLTDTVINQGVGSVGGFYVAYYLSKDAVITTSDTLLYYRYVPSLAQGASNTGSITYNIPNLAPGTYYWGAIVDAFNSQAESNETNNAIVANSVNISL